MAREVYNEKIDYFFGGISDDVRIQKLENCAISTNFDIWTNPKRLTPFRKTEADEEKTYRIALLAYANGILWGSGKKSDSSTAEPKVFYKDSFNAITGSWDAVTTGEHSSTTSSAPALFIEYHSRLYGNHTLTVWAWGSLVPASGTFTDTAYTPSGTILTQGLVTSDDKLLIATTNAVHVKNGAGSGVTDLWSQGIEFPNSRQITDMCEYGDLVAIAVHPGGNFPASLGSRVYLWDKVNEDPSQVIDWGGDHLWILENIDGSLVGASIINYVDEGQLQNKLIIREWAGGTKARTIFELQGDPGTNLFIGPNYTKVRDGSTVSFRIQITKDGVSYFQMATIGRKSAGYPLSFTLSRVVDPDAAVTAINGVFKLSDTWWFAHNSDGSLNRTNNDGDYGNASYITQKLTGESKVADAHRRNKRLTMAGLLVAPLPENATASLYYRIDAESAWTLIRTYSTQNGLGFEAGVADTQGDESVLEEFKNYKELQFKAESTGGAEITGIVWAWQFAGADVQED